MQTKTRKPNIEKVEKPYLTGSFCGKDAWKQVPKRMLAVLGISLLYFIGSVFMSFDSLAGRLISAILIVGLVVYYQLLKGMSQGAADVAYGEMMYDRQAEGKPLDKADSERCFHRLKGFFEAFMGTLPFVVLALIFAFIAKPMTYVLGVLPSWTSELMLQNEFGDALSYYALEASFTMEGVLRVVVRAMTMPFISVATVMGDGAALWAERLSPLFVLVGPMCYGVGYLFGPDQRTRINTGIKMGDDKKRRKERKARKQRRQSKAPERLI